MSELRNYLERQHGLILLDSEVDDILHLARQEIDLPSVIDIIDAAEKYNGGLMYNRKVRIKSFIDGAIWAFKKVHNPYPMTMR